jgi:hypothetical protein
LKKNLGIFIYTIILGSTGAMAIEEAAYKSIFNEKIFEIRKYEPHLLAEVEINGDFEEVGSKAFKKLFRYISGENISQKKIEMTAPVSQVQGSKNVSMTSPIIQKEHNGKWVVSFMMPSNFTINKLPRPKDSDIQLRKASSSYRASVKYSGSWSEKNYLQYLGLLNEWVSKQKLKVIGKPIWARYDAPYVPWFFRRNEILIPIKQP